MCRQPEPPCQHAGELQAAQVHHRRHAADGGEVAVVGVDKGRGRLPLQPRLQRGRDVGAHLLGCRRHTGYRAAVGLQDRSQIAGDKNVRVAWQSQVSVDLDPPGAVDLGTQHAAQRRRRHARRPQHGAAGLHPVTQPVAGGRDVGHRRAALHLDAEAFKLRARALLQPGREAGQQRRAGLDQPHLRTPRVDAAKFLAQRVARYLGQRAGQFNARGAAADHGKVQPGLLLFFRRCRLGAFKGKQHAAADQQRVVQRLQARRVRRPFVVAEIGIGCAAGHQQLVVGQLLATLERDGLVRQVDATHFSQQHADIGLVTQDLAQRRRDVRRRQAGRCHLVQQRLKQVVVDAVDERDVQRRLGQGARGPEAGETAANDHQLGTRARLVGGPIHGTSPCGPTPAGCGCGPPRAMWSTSASSTGRPRLASSWLIIIATAQGRPSASLT